MKRNPEPRPDDIRQVGELLDWAARRLRRAGLHFGHGTGTPEDDAAALVFHALAIAHDQAPGAYELAVDPAGAARAMSLVERRIAERLPSAYLTGVTWFAGHLIHVTPAVLVPRSPIAELCERGFEPWIGPGRARRILDIGTGSGCIAIAAALALPQARVDAVDVSEEALQVALRNIRHHRLQRRVRALRSDVYEGVGGRRYNIIVSNPPYVPESEMQGLPPEYLAEPGLGLRAGRSGLDIVARILDGAAAHLESDGLLVVEVGDTEAAVRQAWPRLPFTWLQFERGGGGVFLLRAGDLPEAEATDVG